MRGRILKGAAPARALPAVLLGCLLAGTFTACTSGDGGDNGGAGGERSRQPSSFVGARRRRRADLGAAATGHRTLSPHRESAVGGF